MKTYRIYLKNGVSFTVSAQRFEAGADGLVQFYIDPNKPDKEICVRVSEVSAIVVDASSEA